MRRARDSFTLVELLVVIAVIAVLAAMLLPALETAQARAASGSCSGNLKTLFVAFQAYSDDYNGFYPITQTDGSADMPYCWWPGGSGAEMPVGRHTWTGSTTWASVLTACPWPARPAPWTPP